MWLDRTWFVMIFIIMIAAILIVVGDHSVWKGWLLSLMIGGFPLGLAIGADYKILKEKVNNR